MPVIGDRSLPARNLGKNAIVRPGNATASVVSINHFMILKRIRGTAGTDYFILITPACPQIGTLDAVVIAVDLEHLEDRAVPY
ncbi:hypothetical protein HX037_02760 [Ignatzschineria indica]|uniref:hypothetical protein n=1 Tax=Ignatzschineria indica TaxID=472583 RepID=UPI0025780C6E|nr:hypothetical protein [Ignatzschineria indica]MDM1544808.1 hypothetical protein [Ignatzschineria indica]